MTAPLIHRHNNGLRFYRRHLPEGLLKRYEKKVNLHEPLQETIFTQILQRRDISWYANVGAGWGYYPLLARMQRDDLKIHAIEPNKNRCEAIVEHMELNHLRDIEIHRCFVGGTPGGEVTASSLDEILPTASTESPDGFLSFDIQGCAGSALKEAPKTLRATTEILIGTHDDEHRECEDLLRGEGFIVLLSAPMKTVPMQPDGILWARR